MGIPGAGGDPPKARTTTGADADAAARAGGLEGGLEGGIARLLRVGTYSAVTLIAIGVVLMLANGLSPVDLAPPLDLRRLGSDLAALRPEGFLWLGLIAILLTPAARVVVSALEYARRGDRSMALIAVLVILVILTGIVLGAPGLLDNSTGA